MVWKLSSFKCFQQGKKRSAWSYVLAGDTLAQGGKRGVACGVKTTRGRSQQPGKAWAQERLGWTEEGPRGGGLGRVLASEPSLGHSLLLYSVDVTRSERGQAEGPGNCDFQCSGKGSPSP